MPDQSTRITSFLSQVIDPSNPKRDRRRRYLPLVASYFEANDSFMWDAVIDHARHFEIGVVVRLPQVQATGEKSIAGRISSLRDINRFVFAYIDPGSENDLSSISGVHSPLFDGYFIDHLCQSEKIDQILSNLSSQLSESGMLVAFHDGLKVHPSPAKNSSFVGLD